MINNFKVTANKTYATAYAVYEIISSLYSGSNFHNKVEEKRLEMNFKLLSETKQVELESQVLDLIEEENLPDLDRKVEIFFKKSSDKYTLCFRDYIDDDLLVEISKGGSKIKILQFVPD